MAFHWRSNWRRARVKVLSWGIARDWTTGSGCLTGGRATALARQQTLLAAIQWSYDHLAPDEQQMLRLLSVFAAAGRCWAMRVVGDQADEYEVLDLLQRLLDRSLVTIERTERHHPLRDAGDRAPVRSRAVEPVGGGRRGAARAIPVFMWRSPGGGAELSVASMRMACTAQSGAG